MRGENWYKLPFARLAVLKCILLGPLQRSEAHVVGNVCV